MFDNIFCKIKKVDNYGIFSLDNQLYIWFEDDDVKQIVKEINISKCLKQMYNFGKIVYSNLINNIKLRENINKIEHNLSNNKIEFVLNYCKQLDILDFEKSTIYAYIYNSLKKLNVELNNCIEPDEYGEWYREIIMFKLCSNMDKNSIFVKSDKTTYCYNNIINLLEKNRDIIEIDKLYQYIQSIKDISLINYINKEMLKSAIEPFIKYCGLPYYYSDKKHDISYNMQNILDTTATTIPCKYKNQIGRNMLPLNNFINICVFIFMIEESNKSTFKDLCFDIEKVLKLSNNIKGFDVENLINSYSSSDAYAFEYKDLVDYLNKINYTTINYYNSFYSVELKNTCQKELRGKNIVNIYNLDNIAVYCWEYYFYNFQPKNSIFDNASTCSNCGEKSKSKKWYYLRGNNKGKKLCEKCYKEHYSEMNCTRVNNFRKRKTIV